MEPKSLDSQDSLSSFTGLTIHTNPSLDKYRSKTQKMGEEILTSLNNVVSEAKKPDAQLNPLLTKIREDCIKVHDFCLKILHSDVPVDSKCLKQLTIPLLNMVETLNKNESPEIKNTLNCVQLEIIEIHETLENIKKKQYQVITPESTSTLTPSSMLVNSAVHEIKDTIHATSLPDVSIHLPDVKIKPMNEIPVLLAQGTEEVDSVASDALGKLQQSIALMEKTLKGSDSTNLTELEHLIARLMEEARSTLENPQIIQEAAKCGTKHENQIRFAQLLEGIKLEGVVVPIPHGISSEIVTHFLRQHEPYLFEQWEKLGTLYTNYSENIPFLDQEDIKNLLESINQAIERAFQSACKDEALFRELVPPDFQKWIETIAENGNFLMVRSSGAEDSRQSANAGGNVSPHYIAPNISSISKAMGEVVCSYFGHASLQNRINAGLNPFEKKPEMSLSVQELIGEPIGGSLIPYQIPVSMVLFTSEPLYVGGEEFRIMRISAGYGHGEGVVGNKGIATDTVLLLVSQVHPDKLYILYDNRQKPEHLAPVLTPEGIQLQNRPIPVSMQNQPALDDFLLRRCYTLGVVGEKFFNGHPTDMEMVVKGGKIFVVQARPINRPDLLPTYIDLKKVEALGNPVLQKIQSEIIVPGEGSVVILNRREGILFAPTLELAEKAYKKDFHKVVVVTQPEPANSHPVVNFSGLGIPCFEVQNDNDIQELLKKVTERNLLVVDTQRGEINLWDESIGPIGECVVKGFAVHPAKIAISLPLAANLPINLKRENVPQEIKDLILSIQSATVHEVALTKLKELRDHQWLQNMKQKKRELKSRVRELTFVPNQLSEGLLVTKQLIKKVEEAFDEARVVLEKKSQQRLHPLFHVKVIEKLLVAPPGDRRGVGQYTVGDMDPIHRNLDALIDYQKSLPFPARFADLFMLGSHGVTPETQKEWGNFLKDFEFLVHSREFTEEHVQQFKQMMKAMETMEMLPTWFALFFAQISRSNLAPHEKIEKLLGSFPLNETSFCNYFLDLHQTLLANKEKINLFSKPESFESGWVWLQGEVEKVLSQTIIGTEGSLEKQLKNCSSVTKILVLKVMNELVDSYDLSIKAMIKSMKANPTYTNRQKTDLFKRMLEPYFGLLLNWGRGIADPGTIHMHRSTSLLNYLDKMESEFRLLLNASMNPYNKDGIDPFDSSPAFSVNKVMLGSNTYIPERDTFIFTLGGMFTLIHQNLQIIMNSNSPLNNIAILENALIPDSFKEIVENMREFSLEVLSMSDELSLQIQMQSLGINDNEIVAKYNIPLRDHAAIIYLRHDNRTGEVKMNGFLLGEGTENNRWKRINVLLSFLDKSNQLRISGPTSVAPNELKFSWKINDFQTLQKAKEWLKVIIETTFYYGDNDNLIQKLAVMSNMSKNESEILSNTVVKAVVKEITDIDSSVRLNAYNLLASLYKNRQVPKDIAESAFIVGVKDEDINNRMEILNFIRALIEGREHDCGGLAIALATSAIKDPDDSIREKAYHLFQMIINVCNEWNAVQTTINELKTHNDPKVVHSAESLLSWMKEQRRESGYGTEEESDDREDY